MHVLRPLSQGVPILDIGPDCGRRITLGYVSPYYERELQEVAGYWNYWRIEFGGLALAHSSEQERGDVKAALKIYSEWASKIASRVHDALAEKIKISPQPLWAEAWIIYALYWGRSQLSLEGLIQNADMVNHAIPRGRDCLGTSNP